MNKNEFEKNKAVISGEIISGFTYSHEIYGEKFYIFHIRTWRLSDCLDVIPVMVSERMIDVTEDCIGYFAEVIGQFRSYNKRDGGEKHLILSVFAREIQILEREVDENYISLDGYICKNPIYRHTPLGREITDLLIAVNRPYSKTDYIPCIVWGRNARYASQLEVGTRIQLEGRIQSREYFKKLDDTSYETRTAYEVSVSRIEVIEESEENKC